MTTLKISASDHPIKSVTVFKSATAEVRRTFIIELQAGQNKVHITGLPGAIDTDSIRVSGLGHARLFDVVCTTGTSQEYSTGNDMISEEVLNLLKQKKLELKRRKSIHESQIEILSSYIKTLNAEHYNPSAVYQYLDDYAEKCLQYQGAVSALNKEIAEVDRLMSKESARASLKKGRALGEVYVVIGTDTNGMVELKLTYIVGDASWEPTYELHANMEGGKPSPTVSLHYRARIKQSTGEDWTDSALTLSTVASDTATRGIPHLRPMKIRPRPSKPFGFPPQAQLQPQQQQQRPDAQFHQTQQPAPPATEGFHPFGIQVQRQTVEKSIAQPAMCLVPQATGFSQQLLPNFYSAAITSINDGITDGEDNFEDVVVPGPFSEPTTVVSESPLAISYAVEGKSSIPSDGVAHQVSIAVLPFEAKITYVAIPRLQPNVYLQCQVKNTSEYRLLPGLVTVILDDSYVSKTSICDINTGDTFHCTLGTDSATKVSYSRSFRTVRSATGSFSEETNTTTYAISISLQNKHAFPILDLIVRDAVPMSDDKRVKVILRKPEGLANAKDGEVVNLNKDGLNVGWAKVVDGKGGEKEGKFEWKWKVDAGAQIKLEAEWEVKAPADVTWVEAVSYGE